LKGCSIIIAPPIKISAIKPVWITLERIVVSVLSILFSNTKVPEIVTHRAIITRQPATAISTMHLSMIGMFILNILFAIVPIINPIIAATTIAIIGPKTTGIPST
jgi:hypothetical protein